MAPTIIFKFIDGREVKKKLIRTFDEDSFITFILNIIKEENIKFRKLKIEKIMKKL